MNFLIAVLIGLSAYAGDIPPEHDMNLLLKKFQEEHLQAHREEQKRIFEMQKDQVAYIEAQELLEQERVLKSNEELKRGKEALRLHLLAEDQKKKDEVQRRIAKYQRIKLEKEKEIIINRRIASNKESLRKKMSPAGFYLMMVALKIYIINELFFDMMENKFTEKR